MSLPAANLDVRHFQDIVDELKKLIPAYYGSQWTDHNVSDPGVTLIELFAHIFSQLSYRTNQIPTRHYIKFMDFLGMKLESPQAASVPITFWLSSPQPYPILIPARTEVATTQTETKHAVVFTTDADLFLDPPRLATLIRYKTENHKYQTLPLNAQQNTQLHSVFSKKPKVDDALYFGFENDISGYLLTIQLLCEEIGARSIDPENPPYVWETFHLEAQVWVPCDIEEDSTHGLTRNGSVSLHIPQCISRSLPNDKKSTTQYFWVRIRAREITQDEKRRGVKHETSPKIRPLACAVLGGTTVAANARWASQENLGRSDGSPGQRFQLKHGPVQKGQWQLKVEVTGEPTQFWEEISHFHIVEKPEEKRWFELDHVSGEIRLGPAIPLPDGSIQRYGAIPPRGARLYFQPYRYGGGSIGNVKEGELNTLKTSIPFINRVSNRHAAYGGRDAESLESAMMRAPNKLLSRERAVTAADFEYLAREAIPEAIGRVKCIQPQPDQLASDVHAKVQLIIIPSVQNPIRPLQQSDLQLSDANKSLLIKYLDEKRLLTTSFTVIEPAYHFVSIQVTLPLTSKSLATQVEQRLYRFLNPLIGGIDNNGWEFGRSLQISDLYRCLHDIPFTDLTIYAVDGNGRRHAEPVDEISLNATAAVIASGKHQVNFV